ncbi:hypothetical protein ARMGADRAFT_1023239 [Armillaria gallica]|uniref:MFS general substrate transporter n=1 Tax=Armillaria gallica TaxID=47427 RepID=A0A2H3E658_ARMGA|nr:hypothetical protein ARMGADRAFT_1023239 [Armillaria gallica]
MLTMSTPGPTKDFDLIPIPQRLRYDPTRPFPEFGIGLNLFFAFACTFRLLFIAPSGDLLRRRQLILGLSVMLCLALASDWNAFLALSFLAGTINVATQILILLVADVVHPAQKFFFLSILISALVMGMLVARVLAGVIAEYVHWRVVYYLSGGVQIIVLVACYMTIPDYPAKNEGTGYWELIKSMVGFAVREPLLIQCFLLRLVIGLFGLVGIAATLTIEKLHLWYGSVLSAILYACFQGLLVGTAGIRFAYGAYSYLWDKILLAIIGITVFCRVLQVSLQMSVFSISKAATIRLNALLLLPVIGSSVGSRVFLESGWRAGAGLSLGWMGIGFFMLLFGYEGGFGVRRDVEQKGEEIGGKDWTESFISVSSLKNGNEEVYAP